MTWVQRISIIIHFFWLHFFLSCSDVSTVCDGGAAGARIKYIQQTYFIINYDKIILYTIPFTYDIICVFVIYDHEALELFYARYNFSQTNFIFLFFSTETSLLAVQIFYVILKKFPSQFKTRKTVFAFMRKLIQCFLRIW